MEQEIIGSRLGMMPRRTGMGLAGMDLIFTLNGQVLSELRKKQSKQRSSSFAKFAISRKIDSLRSLIGGERNGVSDSETK
jgi:hypothetical protein